jgi:hypothetical protein
MNDPDIERLVAAADELLDLEADRADLELGAELSAMSDHARGIVHAVIARAAEIKAVRTSNRHGQGSSDKTPPPPWKEPKPPLGRQSAELLGWLHEDLAAGVAELRAAEVEGVRMTDDDAIQARLAAERAAEAADVRRQLDEALAAQREESARRWGEIWGND